MDYIDDRIISVGDAASALHDGDVGLSGEFEVVPLHPLQHLC
jgi:hypothetical protein